MRAGAPTVFNRQAINLIMKNPLQAKKETAMHIGKRFGFFLLAGTVILLLVGGCSWSIGGEREHSNHGTDYSATH
jgi:hypothetical protein